jgi:hypothetical protein
MKDRTRLGLLEDYHISTMITMECFHKFRFPRLACIINPDRLQKDSQLKTLGEVWVKSYWECLDRRDNGSKPFLHHDVWKY